MSGPRRLLILDFDGTLTDAERASGPFRAGYLEDLALLTGWPLARVVEAAGRHEAALRADPNQGWSRDGRIVAPAGGDPYLSSGPVFRRILDEAGLFRSEPERSLLEQLLFRYNYGKTLTVFRPGARELLRRLGARADLSTWVVTNSETELVQARIQGLDAGEGGVAWLLPRVRGSAGKFEIDDALGLVPAELAVPGLGRPVLLRRARYHAVLDGLLGELGLRWADVVVVGDIVELDLALPLALGARAALITTPHTPGWSRAFVADHPRGVVLDHLDEVLAWLGDD